MKLLIITLLLGACSSNSVKKSKSFIEKKRECHTHYLNEFGLPAVEVIKLCEKELKRGE